MIERKEEMDGRSLAREKWQASGLTYNALTDRALARLRDLINDEMRASGAVSGTLHCAPCFVGHDLRCGSHYFQDRQAITFEPNGFIGLAGWADYKNILPILAGFSAWVDELTPAPDPEKE